MSAVVSPPSEKKKVSHVYDSMFEVALLSSFRTFNN